MITVGQPGGKIFPTGLGMGATQLACAVISLTRAAGRLPIKTVADPFAIMPGPAGTQLGRIQGRVVSVTRAAGMFPIKTVGRPLMIASGNAGCGTGVGTSAGGWIGAWQCGASCLTRSVIRAAGGIGQLAFGEKPPGQEPSLAFALAECHRDVPRFEAADTAARLPRD